MPLSPPVRSLARYATPQTICPSASVIMMKPRPGARSDSTPNNAAAAVDSATAKIAAVSWS